ncbi:MAG: UvrD-helicase domain-containing protein [Thermodesulfobacteriota bacterium]
MREDLTFEQCCALDCNRNMVVTAGPGAGKTKVLTERFCHILLTDDEVSIGEIVAITFTDKAAEEMKARIYLELSRIYRELKAQEGKTSPIVKRIKENLDNFSKNKIGTIHSFCSHLLRQYPVEAGIDPGFTILQGLAQREMMLDSIQKAISSLAKESDDQFAELIRIFGTARSLIQAIRQTIEHPVTFKRILETRDRLVATPKWQEQIFTEYCAYIKDELLVPYYHELKEMKNRKAQYAQVRSSLDRWYANRDRGSDFGIPSVFAELRDFSRQRIRGSSRLAVKQGSKTISYLDLLDSHFPDLFAVFNADALYARGLHIFLELAEKSFESYRIAKRRANFLDFADLESETLEFLTNLSCSENASLMSRIQGRFRYIMVDEFQDTNQSQWEIVRLLADRKHSRGHSVLRGDKLFVVGDKRQAIYRFRGADVTVFEAVTGEIKRSNMYKRKSFFWDDDRIVRRLIKANRALQTKLADQALLLKSMASEDLGKIQQGDIYLGLNFRSCREIIDFCNKTFTYIFSNKSATGLREYECEYPLITKATSGEDRAESGMTAFYLIPQKKACSSSTEQFSKPEREAMLIADIIQRIMGRKGKHLPEYELYGSIREKIEQGETAIGILFFAYTHIKTFETFFREAGLPFLINRGRGFYGSQEVMEVIQLLQYLVDGEQKISLLGALRGPLFGVTDPEIFEFFTDKRPFSERFLGFPNPYLRSIGAQLNAWKKAASHATIPELIRTVMRDRGMMAALSAHPNRAQRMANIEKLIEIARQFEAEGSGTLHDFVSYCTRMAEESDEEGEAPVELPQGVPIHLMTIHSAKGLEFPMVIIPELDRTLPTGQKPGKPVRLYSAKGSGKRAWNYQEGILPLFSVEYPLTEFRKQFSPLAILLKRRDLLEEVAENRRVFYVGCTRAMHHLVFTSHIPVGKNRGHPLSSCDYREGAPLLELLDDIWGLRTRFRDDAVGKYPRGEGSPRIIWEEPHPLEIAGVSCSEAEISQDDFRKRDGKIKELDLTVPLTVPAHYQFSPTALAVYKRCPLRFYYRYEMHIPEDPSFITREGMLDEPWEDKADSESIEPWVIGTMVHAYLERHVFGSALDSGLLEVVFSTFLGQRGDTMLLEKQIIERIKTKARQLITAAITDDVLIELLTGVNQYSEVPFVFNSGAYTLRGRIDKLFASKQGNGWAILDWKTGDPGRIDPGSFAKEHYFDLQMACYRMVVEQQKKTQVQDLYLYFASLGKLVEINYSDDPRKEIEDLERFIERYKADPEGVGQGVKRERRRRGECTRCSYSATVLCGSR